MIHCRPPPGRYSTIDFYRRIVLSSVVLSLPTIETIFMLVFCVSVYCVLMYREVGPYWSVSSLRAGLLSTSMVEPYT